MKDIATYTRRERKKLQCKYTILRAARECFRRSGYEETTIIQIAEAADISYASFFNYFPTKDSLLPAMIQEQFEDMEELLRMEESQGATAMYMIRSILAQTARDIYLNKNIIFRMDALRAVGQSADASIVTNYNRIKDILTKFLQRAMQDGSLRDDISASRQAITLLGITRACLVYGEDLDGCDRMISDHLRLLSK